MSYYMRLPAGPISLNQTNQLNSIAMANLSQQNQNGLLYNNVFNVIPTNIITVTDFISEIETKDEEIKSLKEQLKSIIEKEDEKQKIFKITSPSLLENIKADTVIVYGDVKGNIDAQNVICMKGDISGNINAETVASLPSSHDAKTDYRRNHPSCEFCRFCNIIRPLSWNFEPVYNCGVTNKHIKRLRSAIVCKYYEPKEN